LRHFSARFPKVFEIWGKWSFFQKQNFAPRNRINRMKKNDEEDYVLVMGRKISNLGDEEFELEIRVYK